MKLKITLGLFLATFLLSAQSARMNRDIEVAEKILETLLEEINDDSYYVDNDVFFIGNSPKVEGTYLEGFGAMFSIISKNSLMPLTITTKNKDKKDKVTIVSPNKKKLKYDLEDLEASKEIIQKNFKSIVETFICDYGYLMRQLKDNEKIMIRYGIGGSSIFSWSDKFSSVANEILILDDYKKQGSNYTATITKKDITDFQNNRINDAQLKERIDFVFEEAKDKAEKYKDLDLLASILGKIHKNDYDKAGLYLRRTTSYERIDGLGAIYKLNVRTTSKHYLGSTVIWPSGSNTDKIEKELALAKVLKGKATVKGKEKDVEEELDLDALYTPFLSELKNSIVEYGSIVKNLKDGEALIFKLNFPTCADCSKMPEQLEIMAKKSTLDAYRKDQISLEKAVNQLVQR